MTSWKRYDITKNKKGQWCVVAKDKHGKIVLTVSTHKTYEEAEAEVRLLELATSEL